MQRLSRILMLAAFFTPTIAQAADCPSSKTIEDGFILRNQSGKSEVRKAQGQLVLVTTTFSFGKGNKQIVYSYDGIFDLYRKDADKNFAIHPTSDLSKILPLKKGSRHTISYVPFEPAQSSEEWALDLSVTGQETFAVGRCNYDVLRVKQEFKRSGKTIDTYSVLYSPDLHATLAKVYDEGNGKESIVGYEYITHLSR